VIEGKSVGAYKCHISSENCDGLSGDIAYDRLRLWAYFAAEKLDIEVFGICQSFGDG